MVMSEIDAQILRRDVPEVPVDVVPNGVDCEALGHVLPDFRHQAVVFVASMDSEANNDGALYFLDAILPLLRLRLPDLKVWMVGRQPSMALRERHDGQQVFVTGKVDEVVSYYRKATVSIVPLRSGGGTRLKILEAMGLGIPVVSTSIGAEGIDLRHGTHALLADTDQDFADAVYLLLTDEARLRTISLQARILAEQCYDWPHIERLQNAVHGQALQHRPQGHAA
jgi:glycosyltransferase involved in cell wall biosynthesis